MMMRRVFELVSMASVFCERFGRVNMYSRHEEIAFLLTNGQILPLSFFEGEFREAIVWYLPTHRGTEVH